MNRNKLLHLLFSFFALLACCTLSANPTPPAPVNAVSKASSAAQKPSEKSPETPPAPADEKQSPKATVQKADDAAGPAQEKAEERVISPTEEITLLEDVSAQSTSEDAEKDLFGSPEPEPEPEGTEEAQAPSRQKKSRTTGKTLDPSEKRTPDHIVPADAPPFKATSDAGTKPAKKLIITRAGESVPLPSDEELAKERAQAEEVKKANRQRIQAENERKQKEHEEKFKINLDALTRAGVDHTKKGFGLTGKVMLWEGKYVELTLGVNSDGLLARGYIRELVLGPLTISGMGEDGVYGTEDDGVLAQLQITKDVQQFMLSGLIDISLAMAQSDIIIGSKGFTIFSHAKIMTLFEMKFLAESQGSGESLDFLLKGAVEADFLKVLSDLAKKAVQQFVDKTVKGVESAQKELDAITKKMAPLEKEEDKLNKKMAVLKERFQKKTANAERLLAPARDALNDAQAEVRKLQNTIDGERRKIHKGRESTVKKIRTAEAEVNKLNKEVSYAKGKMDHFAGKASWLEPWHYASVAWWATRLGVVEAARWTAEKVLQGLRELISAVPIDLIPPIPALFIARGAALVALEAAHLALNMAKVAMNPSAMVEVGEMAIVGTKIAGLNVAMFAMKAVKLTAQLALEVAKLAIKAGGAIMQAALSVVDVLPFVPIGATVDFSAKELLKEGALPRLGILARIFGKKTHAQLEIDLKKPETLATAFPDMFAQFLTGDGDPDVMKKIRSARVKYKAKINKAKRLEKKSQKVKDRIESKEERRQKRVEILKENAVRMAKAAAHGVEVQLKAEDAAVEGKESQNKDKTETFDPDDPSVYATVKRNQRLRWWDQWHFTQDNGSLLCNVQADEDVVIALSNTFDGNESEFIYRIIIGCDDNKCTRISDGKRDLVVAAGPHAKLPGKNNIYPLWVSYKNGYIAIGFGDELGKNIIAEWLIEKPVKGIKAFSLSGGQSPVLFTDVYTDKGFSREFGTQYSCYNAYNSFQWHDAWSVGPKGTAVVFDARAGHNLKFGLTSNPGTKQADYIIDVGIENNTIGSVVKVENNGKNYVRKSMFREDEALTKGKGRTSHTYWTLFNPEDGTLAFGHGSEPGKKVGIAWKDEKVVPGITHFSWSSWNNSVDVTHVRTVPVVPIKVPEKYIAINKQNTFEWLDKWSGEANNFTVIFEAKGEEEIQVGLHSSGSDAPERRTFDIILGGWGNTKSVIRDAKKAVLAGTTDPDALVAEVFRYNSYWVTVKDTYIVVGIGDTPGEQIVLEHKVSQPFSPALTHFSFSSGKGFVEYRNSKVIPAVAVATGSQYAAIKQNLSYHFDPARTLDPAQKTVLSFEASASRDIFIGLMDKEAGQPFCQVGIGARKNVATLIRDAEGTQVAQNVRHKGRIKDASNFLPYYLLYDREDKKLIIGRGRIPGEQRILEHTFESAPDLSHYAFSSTDNEVFFKNITTLPAPEASDASTSTALPKRITSDAKRKQFLWSPQALLADKALRFSARSASGIIIGLNTKAPDQPGNKVYEICIGDRGNAQTVIRDRSGSVKARTTDKSARIPRAGDYYPYWITCIDGLVSVGRSADVGKNIVLQWQDPRPPKGPLYVALSSNKHRVLYKDIACVPAPESCRKLQSYTAYKQRGRFKWTDAFKAKTPDNFALTCSVKAKKGCVMLGLGHNVRQDAPDYTYVIGAKQNTETYIAQGVDYIKERSNNPDDMLAQTHEYIPLWFVYNQGYFVAGFGSVIGEGEIIDWRAAVPQEGIAYIAFSSLEEELLVKNIVITENKLDIGSSDYKAHALKGHYLWTKSWMLPPGKALCFQAKGIGVGVGLHTRARGRLSPRFTYSVTIGGAQNTVTTITDRTRAVVAQAEGEAGRIANPEVMADYWLMHKEETGEIIVGTGTTPGQHRITSYTPPHPPRGVQYYSFTSFDTNVAFDHVSIKDIEAQTAPKKEEEMSAVPAAA